MNKFNVLLVYNLYYKKIKIKYYNNKQTNKFNILLLIMFCFIL